MKLLGVVGHSDTGKTTLIEDLAGRLSERGAVGTIKHIDCRPDLDTAGTDTARHRGAGARETYGIADGEWFATGETITLEEAVSRLARSCSYALVEGYRGADLPVVALGDSSPAGEVLASAASADDIETDALLAALEDREPFATTPGVARQLIRSGGDPAEAAVATLRARIDGRIGGREEVERVLEEVRRELERDGIESACDYRPPLDDRGGELVFLAVSGATHPDALGAIRTGIEGFEDELPGFAPESVSMGV